MKAADRELLRENILAQCEHAPRSGLPVSTIIQRAEMAGYEDLKGAEVDQEIRYLESKGFIEQVRKQISPENRRYIATAAGRDELAIRLGERFS